MSYFFRSGLHVAEVWPGSLHLKHFNAVSFLLFCVVVYSEVLFVAQFCFKSL